MKLLCALAGSSAPTTVWWLRQHADITLFAAENRGRNRIERFEESSAEAIVRPADHDSERAIAEAIVTLAEQLDLVTVAEGIETNEHETQVRQLGVAAVQGWRYSVAMSLTDCLDDSNARQRSS